MGLGGWLSAINPVAAIGNIAGGIGDYLAADQDRLQQKDEMAQDRWLQKEFAQKGIQWRAADAKAAGISPLAALGANLTQPAPISVGMEPTAGGPMRAAGQNISRAVRQTMNRKERLQTEFTEQQLIGEKIKNETMRVQLQNYKNGPSMPYGGMSSGLTGRKGLAGQGDTPVTVMSNQVGASAPGQPQYSAGTFPSVSFRRTNDGGLRPTMSEDYGKHAPGILAELEWNFINKLMPARSGLRPPTKANYPIPQGTDQWKWNPRRQAFYPARKGNKSFVEWIDGRWRVMD